LDLFATRPREADLPIEAGKAVRQAQSRRRADKDLLRHLSVARKPDLRQI
jgi:hypothetical protein